MNPFKRENNGWILCPSTRFPGKYYYFNPATGEAIWNFSDMDERRMLSRPNFALSQKWYPYPEPDSPPDEASSPWCYQPTNMYQPDRTFNHPAFGQPLFPRYMNPMESCAPRMPWGSMPQPQMIMKSPMMNMHTFEPVPQMWPYFNTGPSKNCMQEKISFSNNPYTQKVPFNQTMNCAVFPPKQKRVMSTFPSLNQNKDMHKRRSNSASDNEKEPPIKKFTSQTDLHNENSFGASTNIFGSRSIGNSAKNSNQNLLKAPIFQKENDSPIVCKCMLAKTKTNKMSSPFSKSSENLLRPETHLFSKIKNQNIQESALSRAKPIENLTEIAQSEGSLHLSQKDSFIFPLKKIDSEQCNKYSSLSRIIQNSMVSQSEQENVKKQNENFKGEVNETDLRYVLLAKKRNSSASEMKEVPVAGKKIKTCYTNDSDKLRENAQKKRVTFNLAVEESFIEDENYDPMAFPADDPETAEPVTKYVIADIDVLLTEFELIEKFVMTEVSHVLLIPEPTGRDVRRAAGSVGAAGGAGGRRVTTARRLARRLAGGTRHVQVEPESSDGNAVDTGDPYLNCCMKKFNEGYSAMLISNNEALLEKALSLEIECYTVEEMKEYLNTPQPNPFELTKTDAEGQIVPMNSKRTKAENPRQFFLTNGDTENDNQVVKNEENYFLDENFNFIEETNRLEREIKSLYLLEQNQKIKYEELDSEIKEENEKSDFVLENGDAEAKTTKKKIKNINVYNLDGILKRFTVKNKDMNDRIVAKMDDYMCCFTQIMETVVSDILKDMSRENEDPTRPPLLSLLQDLRQTVAEHRTARTLVDRLGTGLESCYIHANGRLKLSLDPTKFIKIFGCATLLVNVLNEIFPADASLCEGGALLEQLERQIEEWGAEPDLPATVFMTPTTPGPLQPRREFVKDPSEVLSFLQKHYPQWRYQPDIAVETYNNDMVVDEDTQVREQPVIRTVGRNLGLLKLNPKKTMVFNSEENSSDKEILQKETKKDYEPVQTDSKPYKPKLIRKLALESTNLPPKMREIDIEKREAVNQEILEMLDDMVTCKVPSKPLTKLYNLKSIIIDKTNPEVDKEKNGNKGNKINDFKNKNGKAEIVQEIKDIRSQIKARPTLETIKESKNENDEFKPSDQNKLTNNTDEVLDLDVLDYSDMEGSVVNKEESAADISNNKLVIVESECNEVTTTQRNDPSPVDNKNMNNNDALTLYSGIDSKQAYSFVQTTLIATSKTFIAIKEFIDTSIEDLKAGKRNEYIFLTAQEQRGYVVQMITLFNKITERESNPQSALGALLVAGARGRDKRVTNYRQVIRKCTKQARIFLKILDMLARVADGNYNVDDLSSVSTDYENMFE